MASETFVFNIAKGRVGEYVNAVLAGGNDAIVWVPMNGSDESAANGRDADTLAAVEALATFAEQTAGGWARITQDETGDGLTWTVDDTDDEGVADSNDLSFGSPTGGNNTVGLIACYDPDTTTGSDSDLIPLVHLVMNVTADGNAVTYQHNAEGWYNAT
ncbi:MAG: hypothetical protein EHM90_02210 [Chloroflexi bacterium]|nr:MAG: hypothetical protein EHM90_02210 [Chloroflexota bacterium]